MKKLIILVLAIGLAGLYSCEKDMSDKAELKATPTKSALNMEEGKVTVLQKADAEVPIDYTWSASDFGAQVITTYNLEFDKKGNNFEEPFSIGIVKNALTLSILTSDLNAKLLGLCADPENPEQLELEFRIKATVSEYVDPAYSAIVNQKMTPYGEVIVYPWLNVPGNYQGWNPADMSTAIASKLSNEKYEGYMWFPAATEFKYAKGSWDTNWGDDGGDGTLEPGGANILCPEEGYYKLNANLVDLKHTFVKTDWGVIGSATPGGWDTDTDMMYDQVTKVWTVTMDLTAAEIKFRSNNDWALNYGDDGADGKLEEGGANIVITVAGNYTITLDLSKPVYRYKLVKN
jgi:hypothetical protein